MGNDSLLGDWEGVRGGCVERNLGWEFKVGLCGGIGGGCVNDGDGNVDFGW